MMELSTKTVVGMAAVTLAWAALPMCFGAGRVPTLTSKAVEGPGYHKIASYVVGGEGGWDYLIAGPSHRLFISRGSHVMVVDENSGKIVGDIPETTGVHGIAFSTKHNRGYTSNGRDNTVTEFDLSTLKVIKKIPITGQNPDCIIFDTVADRVITCNGRSGDVSVIDPSTEKEAGKIDIGGKLEFAVSDSKGNVFVNNEDKSEIDEVNPISLKMIKKWSIAPAEGPSGLAIDAKKHRLYSVTDAKMVVSDAVAGKVLTMVTIGEGADAAAFDPGQQLAFSSNGQSATLSIVKETSPGVFSVVQTVETQKGARTMALDNSNHKVFLVTAEFGPAAAGQRRAPMKPNSFTILVYGR